MSGHKGKNTGVEWTKTSQTVMILVQFIYLGFHVAFNILQVIYNTIGLKSPKIYQKADCMLHLTAVL